MKHLLIAAICLFAGFSAHANDLKPKKAFALAKVATKSDSKIEINASPNKSENIGFFRRQMCFTFTDLCGQTMQVWVSGPSSISNYELWHTALEYSQSQLSWGCYK